MILSSRAEGREKSELVTSGSSGDEHPWCEVGTEQVSKCQRPSPGAAEDQLRLLRKARLINKAEDRTFVFSSQILTWDVTGKLIFLQG